MNKIGTFLEERGRFVVAFVSLGIAFALSIQFSGRGVQFDLSQTPLSASEASSEEGEYKLSELKILNRALLQIKDGYVKPDRVTPSEMLVSALDEVQKELPEVVIHYEGDPKNPEELRVQVVDEQKTFKAAELESLWEMSFRLKEIFGFIERHTEPEPEQTFKDIEYAAINGLLSTLDPHSTLLPPKHYKEMQTQTGGEFGGLGIVISIREGQLTVISPIDGTPASGKGIQARDKIVRIEDESTINMNLNEAVNMLRGKPGTDVNIWVDRKGWSEPRKFTITRDKITIKSVNSEPLGDKIGYVRIKNFQANTLKDLKKHLSQLKQKMGGVEGLVLDMRDNPGGLLDQAIKVSDLFLEKGTIVSTVGAGKKMRDKKVATKSGTEPKYPIIALVNAGSASASEIVSGALQNHDRAIVMGDTSFGKGTVQVLYEFPDSSALKLTVAEYLTPGGVSIQSRGITPDLRLIPARIGETIDMFLSNDILREGDLEAHLSTEAAGIAEDQGLAILRYLEEGNGEEDEEEEQFRDPNAFQEDFQINLGESLLAAAGATSNRKKMLEKLQPKLKEANNSELGKIQKRLKQKHGVDWTAGPSPEEADVKFDVAATNDGEVVEAGETLTLKATLTNRGESPLYRVKAISNSDNNALDDKEFLFGHVEPGESKEWSVDVEIPKDMATRHELVKYRVSDENNSFGEPRGHAVRIEGRERPRFSFGYEIDDSSGDGTFQLEEEVTLRVFVRNVGRADSSDTMAYLKSKTDDAIYLEKGRINLGKVEKGSTKPAEFEFRIKEAPDREKIRLQLDIYDETFREFTQKEIEIPFSSQKPEVSSASGRATIAKGPAKIFSGANSSSSVIGTASSSAAFPVVAETDGWRKLDLGRQTGWIQDQYVEVDSDAAGGEASSEGLNWARYESPNIALTPEERLTGSAKVDLEGSISDNTAVRDYYVYVYHREDVSKVQSRKVTYDRVGQESADVETSVPLFDGMNRISIVARDDEAMSMQKSIYVYRK